MFNPFPELLTFSLMAPFFVRTALGFIFLRLGTHTMTSERHAWEHFSKEIAGFSWKWGVYVFGAAEIIFGIMLVLGVYTQIAALITALMSLKILILSHFWKLPMRETSLFYFLALAASLSLVFSGAGFFALDLPL